MRLKLLMSNLGGKLNFMKPNIFKIATKELSQDAFITWLLQWADESNMKHDENLCLLGKEFILSLIRKINPDFNDHIINVKAGRQWENIDVWAEINNKYLLIIEDKTFTSKHSGQLTRYRNIALEWCNKNNYLDYFPIYLKTGNESLSSLEEVKKEGFEIFNRIDFIEILQKHSLIRNEIFQDYLKRLNSLEERNKQWLVNPINNWKSNDWQGFFQYLEKEDYLFNWNFVNNPSGGFWNGLVIWKKWKGIPFYIQLEQNKLCFKISVASKEGVLVKDMNSSEIRNLMSKKLIQFSRNNQNNNIIRPKRFGTGSYMTIAVVEDINWLGDVNEIINVENVKLNLKKYINLFNSILESENILS